MILAQEFLVSSMIQIVLLTMLKVHILGAPLLSFRCQVKCVKYHKGAIKKEVPVS